MPTYQYACTACDHRFDAVQSFSDASLTECPACTGGLRKVFSSVGIVFKGSGFYRTDSRKGATVGAKAEAGGKESSAGGSSGDSKSGDSKSGDSKASTSPSSTSSGSSSNPKAAATSS